MSILAKRILERRTTLGLSQARLARAAGIDPSYVFKIENDLKNPTAPVIRMIAEALDCTPNDLMY